MPSGKTHDKISIVFLPVLLVILYFIGFSLMPIIIITISYLFSSFMFNGDLDIKSRPYRRWGPLRFIWLPYQSTFSHRSIFTHGFFLGTAIRLIYLLFIPIIILFIMDYDLTILLNINVLYILIGLEAGSALHTISDYLS